MEVGMIDNEMQELLRRLHEVESRSDLQRVADIHKKEALKIDELHTKTEQWYKQSGLKENKISISKQPSEEELRLLLKSLGHLTDEQINEGLISLGISKGK